jgi:hypothetical protein
MGKLSNPQRSSKLTEKVSNARSINTEVNPTDYIIRNMTPNPVFIADIKLSLPPFESEDLTHEDPMYIRASRDLSSSLDLRVVQKISRDTHNKIRAKKLQKARDAWEQEERDSNVRERYGRNAPQLMDINAPTGKNKSRVSTAGYANDSNSFLAAYEVAAQQAESKGEYLDPEDFAEYLAKNKDNIITPQMLKSSFDPNHQQKRGNAYYAEPDGRGGATTKRFSGKDDISLDLSQIDVDLDLTGMSESIDLELD